MDALRRAQAFVRAQPLADTGGGKSGKSGESAANAGDIPPTPLFQPRRITYEEGCIVALEALRVRLQRGLVILAENYSLTAERRWFRLATRAIRIIARMSDADWQAGEDFVASDLGQWYLALEWPKPSPAALCEDW